MGRTAFSEVRSGQPLDIIDTEYNAFIRLAQEYLTSFGGISGLKQPLRVELPDDQDDYIPGEVLLLGKELRNPDVDGILAGKALWPFQFEGTFPGGDSDPRYSLYVVLLEPGKKGEAVLVNLPGVARAVVYMNESFHRYARPRPGTARLESTTDPMSPFVLLGEPSDPTGDVDKFMEKNVWQKGISTVTRKVQVTQSGGIPLSGSGEVTFLNPAGAGFEQWQGADHKATGYADHAEGTEAIGQDREAFATYLPDENRWQITGADCEPEPQPAPPGHGDNITANPAQSQGSPKLTYQHSRVSTAVAHGDSVTLRSPDRLEDYAYVLNDTNFQIQIYPEVGDMIDGNAADVPVTLQAKASVTFHAVQLDRWYS